MAKKGCTAWNKGISPSNEVRQKMSLAHKGKKLSEENKRKIGIAMKGRIISKEWRNKISLSRKGIKFTEEHRRKLSLWQKGKYLGEKSPSWKGGRRYRDGYVYIYIPSHPHATNKRYVYEHHLVMEKHMGRFLKKGEVVHHINGIRDDNRIENLLLFSNTAEHSKYHHMLKGNG